MKKLVVSPSTAQTQTRPISGIRSISPWPAITPPAITTVSPGRDQADERAGLEKGHHAHERVGPGPERLRDVPDHLLRVGQLATAGRWRRRPARARSAAAISLRSPLSSRRRHTAEAAISTATAAATIWPADTRATVGQVPRSAGAARTQRARRSSAARLRRGRAVAEQAEAGRARAADQRGERARGAQRVEHRGELGAQRERRGLEVVLERPGAASARRRARAARSGSSRSRPPPSRSSSRVDGRRREPSRLRHEHGRERRQLDRLDELAHALHQRVARARPGSARPIRGRAASSRSAAASSGSPAMPVGGAQHGGGVGAAAAEPGGHRDALLDRARAAAAAPGTRSRKAASGRRRRGSGRRRRGSRRCRSPRRGSSSSSSRRSIDANSEQSGCRPSARGRPTCSTRLSFAKARSLGGTALIAAAAPPAGRARSRRPAAASPRAGAARRGRRPDGRSRVSAARVASRRPSGAPGSQRQRAGQRLAPVGEARRGPAPSLGRAARARGGAAAPAPTRRSARGGTPCAARGAGRAPRRRAGPAPRSRRRTLPPGCRGQALADLALHHRHPQRARRAAPRST